MAGKKEIVKLMREESGLTHEEAQKGMELTLRAMKTLMQKGRVAVHGFGVFERKKRKGRWTPLRGGMTTPDKVVTVFKELA